MNLKVISMKDIENENLNIQRSIRKKVWGESFYPSYVYNRTMEITVGFLYFLTFERSYLLLSKYCDFASKIGELLDPGKNLSVEEIALFFSQLDEAELLYVLKNSHLEADLERENYILKAYSLIPYAKRTLPIESYVLKNCKIDDIPKLFDMGISQTPDNIEQAISRIPVRYKRDILPKLYELIKKPSHDINLQFIDKYSEDQFPEELYNVMIKRNGELNCINIDTLRAILNNTFKMCVVGFYDKTAKYFPKLAADSDLIALARKKSEPGEFLDRLEELIEEVLKKE